jgi:hypothetical protein
LPADIGPHKEWLPLLGPPTNCTLSLEPIGRATEGDTTLSEANFSLAGHLTHTRERAGTLVEAMTMEQ